MRKVSSIVVAVSFVVLLVTIVFMTAGEHHERRPGGPPAMAQRGNAQGFRPPHGRPGFFPKGLHEISGYTLILFGTVHVVYNGKCLLSYVGVRRRRR